MPGIDPRLWVSYGTVGTVDDDGNVDPTDWQSIHVGPEGVEVDVLLEPSRIPTTCHYFGMAGGRAATVTAPIRPGDLVLVTLPGGDTSDMPVISAIMHSEAHPVPVGPDRLPIFKNDSVFVWAEDVPVDIRTKGGARIRVNQDGTVEVNEGTLGVARKTDPVEVTISGLPAALNGVYALAASLLATGLFVPAGVPPPAAPVPDVVPAGTITKASGTVKAGGNAE